MMATESRRAWTSRAPFDRVAGWCGIAAALLYYASGVLSNAGGGVPFPPAGTAEKITRYYVVNGRATFLAGYLSAVVAGLLVLFAVGAWSRLQRYSEDAGCWSLMGLCAGVVLAASLVTLATVDFALGAMAGVPRPAAEIIASVSMLRNAALIILGLAAAPFLGGFGIATLRTAGSAGSFPRWLGWLAVAGAACGLLAALPDIVAPSLEAAAGLLSIFGEAQQLLILIWLLGASVCLLRSQTAAPADELELREA